MSMVTQWGFGKEHTALRHRNDFSAQWYTHEKRSVLGLAGPLFFGITGSACWHANLKVLPSVVSGCTPCPVVIRLWQVDHPGQGLRL